MKKGKGRKTSGKNGKVEVGVAFRGIRRVAVAMGVTYVFQASFECVILSLIPIRFASLPFPSPRMSDSPSRFFDPLCDTSDDREFIIGFHPFVSPCSFEAHLKSSKPKHCCHFVALRLLKCRGYRKPTKTHNFSPTFLNRIIPGFQTVPHLTIVTVSVVLPESLPHDSMALTNSLPWMTSPKTVCLPFK